MRFVICTLGGDGDPWRLPRSSLGDRLWISGGERSLYELAMAIACTGREVELRGELSRRALDELREATGAAPVVGMHERRPDPHDQVVVPEGWPDPIDFARVALSPGRAIILLLAPPGLFGWPFVAGWKRPDPLTVDVADLARPEHFQGMRSLGFSLWTHSRGIEAATSRAGVPCTFIGTGQPLPFPDPPAKTHDVAYVEGNRWAPLAREVAANLPSTTSVLPIEEVDRAGLLRRLGSARILVFPSRVEGTARIQLEARALGTVPVALSTNPFAAGLHEAAGAVTADAIEEMPEAVMDLLARPDRLQELSDRALRSARAEVDWPAFLARLAPVLGEWEGDVTDRGAEARAEIGAAIEDLLAGAGSDTAVAMRRERDAVREELDAFRARRSVRAATRLADLARPVLRSRRRARRH